MRRAFGLMFSIIKFFVIPLLIAVAVGALPGAAAGSVFPVWGLIALTVAAAIAFLRTVALAAGAWGGPSPAGFFVALAALAIAAFIVSMWVAHPAQ